MEYFWEKEKVKTWFEAIFENGGTEVVSNMLCLAPQVHAYHERALFALQPVERSEDSKCQKVKFHWLYPHRHEGRVALSVAPEIPEDHSSGPRQLKLYDLPTDRKLCSGDEISITTPDPDRLPLPNPWILEMQWTLQQVGALKGGGEALDDDDDDDDDDGGWEEVLGEIPEWILSPESL